MDFLVNNWYLLLAAIAAGFVIAIAVMRFANLPRSEQIEKISQWLILACTKAEAELGAGTGKLKLPYVYDMFVTKFPWLSRIITFERFSCLVDEALVKMRKLLEDNAAAKALVDKSEVKISE